jgi:hypothetical protein
MAVHTTRILAGSSNHCDRKFVSVMDEGAVRLAFVFFDIAIASVKALCKATAVITFKALFIVLR